MTIPVSIAIAIAVLFGFAPITQGRGDRIDSKQLERFRTKVGLPLPPGLAGPVLARIGHRERWALWGGMAGIAAGALLGVLGDWTEFAGLFVMIGVALGASIGIGFATVQTAHRASPESPRVARPVSTEVRDYVPGRHLLGARGVVALAVVANAVELTVVATGAGSTAVDALPFVVYALVAVAVAALTETVARMLVRRPQRASTDLELAWDDVLRADAGHQLVLSQVVVGGLAAFAAPVSAGLFDVLDGTLTSTGVVTLVVAVVAFVLVVTAMAMVCLGGWFQHPLTRLWEGRTFDAAEAEAAVSADGR